MYFYAFYPAGLDVASRRRPTLTISLIVVMAVVFLWAHYVPWWGPLRPYDLIFWPGNGAPWTVLSAVFLHGGWLHLVGNLVYLWVFAPAFEDRLGRGQFLLLLAMLGAAGNLAHGQVAAADWLGQGGLGVMGASGAISGLLGMALVRLSFARVAIAWWIFAPLQGQNRAGRAHLPIPVAVLGWLALQIANTALARESGTTVSYGAHLGGFGLGVLLALGLGMRREARAEAALQRGRAASEHGRALVALGEYAESVEICPGDDGARRELARAQLVAGCRTEAMTAYRDLYRGAMERGHVGEAQDIYREARHGQPGLGLSAPELATLAVWCERTGDEATAVLVYEDLLQNFPDDAASERAWVRMVMLLHGKLDRYEEARVWLHRAATALPPGAWRDHLAREFNLATATRAGRGATGAGWRD